MNPETAENDILNILTSKDMEDIRHLGPGMFFTSRRFPVRRLCLYIKCRLIVHNHFNNQQCIPG